MDWYINNTEPTLKAWLNLDTAYFVNYIHKLESDTNKNTFYSNLTDFYTYSGRVIIPFDDSCQNEIHHVFNDLYIDSEKETLNKMNAINGMKTYMKSKLLFQCNLSKHPTNCILPIN